MTNPILLSIDVEEFDLPREYGLNISDREALELSLRGLLKVLEILDSLDITTTCFTTAHFAMGHRGFIQSLSDRHEIACHGYYHSKNSEGDLKRAKKEIEDVTGKEIVGHRQPRLETIEPETLIDAGFHYDSSLNPLWLPGRYMNLFKPRLPFKTGNLWNLPISVSPIIRFPLFWLTFKNIPQGIYKMLTAWTVKYDGYLNIYFHPWEFADISGFDLPFYIKKRSGSDMLQGLREWLLWLKGKGGYFITSCRYVKEVLQR